MELPIDVMSYVNKEPDRMERRKQNLTTKRQFGDTADNDSSDSPEPIVSENKIGRNEKITIKNTQTGENKTLKYKHALPLLENSDEEWVMLK